MAYTTKTSRELTLHDRLSRLTFPLACKLLGPEGPKLIQKGGSWDIDVAEQVALTDEHFRLTLPIEPGAERIGGGAVVTIERAADHRDYLHWQCSGCDALCEHVGAAFS